MICSTTYEDSIIKKNIQWLLPVLTCILQVWLFIFLPVLSYEYPNGQSVSFNVFGFVEQSEDLLDILASYNGPFEMYIDKEWLTILAFLAVLAIILAFVGVITMSLQRPNTWQFVMALFGIIGTAIPAIISFIAAPISQRYLPGAFSFGVYPIITLIAMILCMIAVTKKHKNASRDPSFRKGERLDLLGRRSFNPKRI